jgi:hypothetical protein
MNYNTGDYIVSTNASIYKITSIASDFGVYARGIKESINTQPTYFYKQGNSFLDLLRTKELQKQIKETGVLPYKKYFIQNKDFPIGFKRSFGDHMKYVLRSELVGSSKYFLIDKSEVTEGYNIDELLKGATTVKFNCYPSEPVNRYGTLYTGYTQYTSYSPSPTKVVTTPKQSPVIKIDEIKAGMLVELMDMEKGRKYGNTIFTSGMASNVVAVIERVFSTSFTLKKYLWTYTPQMIKRIIPMSEVNSKEFYSWKTTKGVKLKTLKGDIVTIKTVKSPYLITEDGDVFHQEFIKEVVE